MLHVLNVIENFVLN